MGNGGHGGSAQPLVVGFAGGRAEKDDGGLQCTDTDGHCGKPRKCGGGLFRGGSCCGLGDQVVWANLEQARST